MLTGWSAGCVSWCRMRTLRPDWAAALNTARRKFSLLTTCEQEGEQDTSWLDLFESDGVQFAVTLQGIAQYVFMFGESWWIQDDEIVVASHLFRDI